jgi:predicted transposase/invertase (TIGR01784 family)
MMNYISPKNDVAFKKIFGVEKNKDILMHFLNDVIEREDKQKIVDVTLLNPIQYPEGGGSKQSIVDVLCREENGTRYIVEMQVSKVAGFEKRAQYYAAKAYFSQAKEGDLYADLKEVIFLAIIDFEMFPNKKHYKSVHVTLDQKTHERDLRDFSFTFIELKKFNKTIDELETYEDKWCYFFKHASRPGQMTSLTREKDDVISKAFHELEMHNWTSEEMIAYEASDKRERDHLAREDYLEKTATARGLEKGRKAGLKEGMKKGLQKGRQEGMEAGIKEGIETGQACRSYEVAKSLVQIGLPIEMIANISRLSQGEVQGLFDKV